MQNKIISLSIVLNPAAGGGKGRRLLPKVRQALADAGLTYELAISEFPGQAVDLTERAVAAGCKVVVAAGGDGTVNEVINGLMQARQKGLPTAALGVLCVGRGNDFASGVGIPANLDLACQVLRANQHRVIDLGRVTGGKHPQGRYFGNCVGVGFDAVGTIEASRLPNLGGFLSYLIAVFRTIFLYNQAPLARIQLDEQELIQRSLLVSIMNGRRIGGGFIMAPQAQPDDAWLDICIADQMSPWQILKMIPHFTRGTQESQKGIRMARARKVSIESLDYPIPAQTDGEIISIEGMKLEVELLPDQLEVVAQQGGGER